MFNIFSVDGAMHMYLKFSHCQTDFFPHVFFSEEEDRSTPCLFVIVAVPRVRVNLLLFVAVPRVRVNLLLFVAVPGIWVSVRVNLLLFVAFVICSCA